MNFGLDPPALIGVSAVIGRGFDRFRGRLAVLVYRCRAEVARIHAFNGSVAHVWAEQEHLLKGAGQRMPVEDGTIAATARRRGLTIVTGNDKDFRRPGLKVFNPFKDTDPAE